MLVAVRLPSSCTTEHGNGWAFRSASKSAMTAAVRDPTRSIFELAGKRVGTLNQTYAHDILLMVHGIEPKVYEGNEEPYRDLELGRTEGVSLDNIIADQYGCTQPALYCVPYDVARGTYVIGMPARAG